jgi:hypothetical protein
MWLRPGTKLEMTRGSAVDIDFVANWIDITSTAVSEDSTLGKVTTGGTGDLVTTPAASTTRKIKFLSIRNVHASSSNALTINLDTGGTDHRLMAITLLAGEAVVYVEGQGWIYYGADGSIKDAAVAAAPNSTYRTVLDVTGSHTAARIAGTYGFGHGDPLAISGTGTLYPLDIVYLQAADFPTVYGLTAKLRLKAQLYCNDVAPFTGTFVFGLHPITRPATSGGAGLVIYTIGAAVANSTVTFTNPAADSSNNGVSADFTMPADGHYCIGVVTNQAMAASAHCHLSALLQMRNA